jgi:hypothetical protein
MIDEETRKKIDGIMDDFRARLKAQMDKLIGAPLDKVAVEKVKATVSDRLQELLGSENESLPPKHLIALGNLFSLAWFPVEERKKIHPKDLVRHIPLPMLEDLLTRYPGGDDLGWCVLGLEAAFRRGHISDWEWKWKEDGSGGEAVYNVQTPVSWISGTVALTDSK